MIKYDYLIVGSGLYGATFAYRAKRIGKKCLVIDKRPQLGGNIYCEQTEGINVHKYGAHIFHTSNKKVWDFVNSIVEFNRYTNCPVANYKGELYNLPFNMNTFNRMWPEVLTPAEAQAKIDEQRAEALVGCFIGARWHFRAARSLSSEVIGHEFEQTPGDGRGQRRLPRRSPQGRRESDTAERLTSKDDTVTGGQQADRSLKLRPPSHTWGPTALASLPLSTLPSLPVIILFVTPRAFRENREKST